MRNIFSLYCETELVKTFTQLNHVIAYMEKIDLKTKYEIYVEEYNDNNESSTIKTLLFKNNIH
jgi:hypothetical protein